jgi:hypothetical protein
MVARFDRGEEMIWNDRQPPIAVLRQQVDSPYKDRRLCLRAAWKNAPATCQNRCAEAVVPCRSANLSMTFGCGSLLPADAIISRIDLKEP